MKRILLVTSKSPTLSEDFDGGSVLVSQLCDFLPSISYLDILLLRKPVDIIKYYPKVKNIIILEPIYASECRFTNRLLNADRTCRHIKKIYKNYEKIFIVHISNSFGIEKLDPPVRSKIVLFPMFTGESYLRSGEVVPTSYINEELKAINSVERISSPSRAEIKQLVTTYKVNPKNILLHPRGIDFNVFPAQSRTPPKPQEKLSIAYVAAIRPQKNQIETIQIIAELKKRGFKPVLHIIGGIGCYMYYKNLSSILHKCNCVENYVFHGAVSQMECSRIISQCHFGISVSKWETFGKGLFEGLATGLPSFAYEHLECLWEYLPSNSGIKLLPSNPYSIPNEIEYLMQNPSIYKSMAVSAINDVRGLNAGFSINKMVNELVF